MKMVDMFDFFSIMEVMARGSYLGEFELMLLLTVLHLGDEAYGVPVACELESRRGRSVSVSSVYAALERLETKGSITSELGNPLPSAAERQSAIFALLRKGCARCVRRGAC